jgi:uncharacterized membrane protein YsdA (DUF1294 family)
MSRQRTPFRSTFLLFGAMALTLAVATRFLWEWPMVVAWLAAANVTALGIWGWDKWMARRGASRVPEATLHAMAILGASPASLAGMALFRHKVRDWKFRVLHLLLLVAQIAVLGWVGGEEVRAWFGR